MKLLKRTETAQLLGMDASTFDRQVRGDPTFPKPCNVTGNKEGLRWVADEVEEWVMSRRES